MNGWRSCAPSGVVDSRVWPSPTSAEDQHAGALGPAIAHLADHGLHVPLFHRTAVGMEQRGDSAHSAPNRAGAWGEAGLGQIEAAVAIADARRLIDGLPGYFDPGVGGQATAELGRRGTDDQFGVDASAAEEEPQHE